MPFTDYLDQKLVQHAFGGVIWTPPADLYVALSSSAPTQAVGSSGTPYNFTEVTGLGYSRVASANNGTDWVPVASEPASGYEVQNGVVVAFPLSTGAWDTGSNIGWFGIFDAATAGNLLAYGALTPPESVPSPGYIVTFAVGQLTTSLD